MVRFAGDLPEGLQPPRLDLDEVEPTIANLGGPVGFPAELIGEIQLEELEADTSTVTALRLNQDGSVGFSTTDGPLPLNCNGNWASDGDDFMLIITRTFEQEGNVKSTYSVTRILTGSVEEKVGGYTTLGGEVKIGDIGVGYFKAIALPDDVDKPRSSLQVKTI